MQEFGAREAQGNQRHPNHRDEHHQKRLKDNRLGAVTFTDLIPGIFSITMQQLRHVLGSSVTRCQFGPINPGRLPVVFIVVHYFCHQCGDLRSINRNQSDRTAGNCRWPGEKS